MTSQLSWDPEIDTPATIAVIGGSSCGIEAALYARFLGYSVELFEANKIGDSILAWGDRPMPGTWREISSSLGLAALEAHDHELPEMDAIPSCREYVEQYLLPLARCDLLLTFVNNWTKVLAVSRLGCSHLDSVPIDVRAGQEFRLLAWSNQRGEYSQIVDLVLDCSGEHSVRQLPGSGGGQPIGWSAVASQVIFGKCDCLGKRRQDFSGKRVLLLGSDVAAVENAIELSKLAASEAARLFWVVQKRLGRETDQVFAKVSCPTGDNTSDHVVRLTAWGIEAVRYEGGEFVVTLQTTEDATVDLRVDKIVHCGDTLAQRGYHHNLLLGNPALSDDGLTAEPHYYWMGTGAKDEENSEGGCGRNPFELMRSQIRRVFALIGGRSDLDLYRTVQPQSAKS